MAPLARIHLDPVGGIAGDMFAAAMADAFPEHVAGLLIELRKISPFPAGEGRGGGVAFTPHSDGVLRGQRFVVEEHGDHGHEHVTCRAIRKRLQGAGLEPEVLRHAVALFEMLAKAEAKVHGVAPDEVEFHEVGAWDSIADMVAAAYFIATLAPQAWTIGALPLGGGRVETAHGWLPVPAPATAVLLEGMEVIDDGIPGERVTPTGAAIAAYLCRLGAAPERHTGTLAATGHGFGTRKLPGIPNVLRCLAFVASPVFPAPLDEEIATLQFEIDDQTAEDLAVALDRIRAATGVLDVTPAAAYGKKGRLATHVQVLARVEAADAVADLCIAQTTTLGVRIARAWRRTVLRSHATTTGDVRVKVAQRPDGKLTAKAEIDDLARIPGERERREEARRRAEREALESAKPYGSGDREPG